MALLSKQDLRNLFDQLTNEYEYLSNNRLKLEADCKKLQEYIEDQINQIKQINTDFEKLRQEFIQRGSESSKVFNEGATPYRDNQNEQNSAYMQQNSAYQQQQLIQQQNIGNNASMQSNQMTTQNQGMQIIGSQQQPQSQYANEQYSQQQQQMPEQQIQEEDPDQGWEFSTLVSADQIHDPVIISLFAEILDTSVICSTEFSPDGTCLAIGSDKMLRVYNIENDSFLMEKMIANPSDEYDKHNYVRSIIWTSDGNTIICGSEDSKIRSFDLSKPSDDGNSSDIGKLTHCFEAGNGEVFQLQISKDNSFFASVTSDGSLTIYSLDSSVTNENDSNYLQYQILAVLTRSNDDPSKTIAATSLSISYDNKYIAVGYTDTSVVIWDAETKTPIVEQKCHSKDIYTLKFLPDGRLVTASLDASIKIWDVSISERTITKEVEVIVQTPNESQEENNDNKDNDNDNENKEEEKPNENENQDDQTPQKAEESKDDTEKKEETEQNKSENESNQTEEAQKQENEEVEHPNENNENENDTNQSQKETEANDENRNKETEVVTSIVKEAKLDLWREITGHTDFVLSLAVDPSGTWLLSGSKDLTARLTNLDDGVMVYSIKAHKNSIITVCFNPNGKMFCTGSGDNYVKFWSINPEEDIDA